MKVAVIGGGSSYTPELVSCLSRDRERLEVGELALHDIDPERLEIVGGLAGRMLEQQGFAGELRLTGELERALDGADFVLLQIRVGGQAARLLDETVPLEFGCIGQETTGAGGFAKALRTVPVVLGIAEQVRARAADGGWIVDFTNPVSIVTRALLDAGHRAVGLCNVAITFQRRIAGMLGVPSEQLAVDQVGLNHLTWIRGLRLDGEDVLGRVLAEHAGELAEEIGLPAALLEELGAIPSYYLHYYWMHDEVLAEQRQGTPRATVVAETERELLELYRDPRLVEKPALLEKRGGAFYSEAAMALVASLHAGSGDIQIVDTRNHGAGNGVAVPGLALDDVVELPARIERTGPAPLGQPPLAPELLGLVQHVAAYERLTAQAAVSGDRVLARKALLAHPLIGRAAIVEPLLERLLEAGATHLPQFGARAGV
jgi:6-phospho-beta-glucosidase